MEVKKSDNREDEDGPLPGFRFHPTDEELVGFYLRRKVERKPLAIELIKNVDIYKFNPWDLPVGSNVGDKEWYFFCKRGRKYRNSIRPNRVTGSGFWKATGIDKPIYSTRGPGAGRECIGLKKSLVYYRGGAGKGTKTDWMMHEFRLPSDHDDKSIKHIDFKNIIAQDEAEVWTLCRILKRNKNTRKCILDSRELSAAERSIITASSSKTCTVNQNTRVEGYDIDFRAPFVSSNGKNLASFNHYETNQLHGTQLSMKTQALSSASCSNFFHPNLNDTIKNGGWDELKSFVDFDFDPFRSIDNKSI